MEKISVVMSVYNEEINILEEAIESILNQTYKNLEFIIVLDKPDNKEALNILNQYANKDNRVKIIVNQVNIGLTESLNKALEVCEGKYIARMDADDVCMLDRFEIQLKYFKQYEDLDFLASSAIMINDKGNELFKTNNYGGDFEKCKKALEYRNIFLHPTWLFKRGILDKVKKYNEIPKVEDYDFICRVILNGYKVYIADDYLIKCRIRSNGITRSNLFLQKYMADIVREEYKLAIKENDISLYSPENKIESFKTNVSEINRYNKACYLYDKGIVLSKQKSYLKASYYIIKSCLSSRKKLNEIYSVVKLKQLNRRK